MSRCTTARWKGSTSRSSVRARRSAIELAEAGVLEKLGIELIGAGLDAIKRAEDRELFRNAVNSVGLQVPSSKIVRSLDDLGGVSLPAVVRPAFTLGGHGGGFVSTP